MTIGMPGDTFEFSRLEPAEAYEEAALKLRYKRITAITATKLQRAMALLQLEPHHLVKRGLASRSSLVQDLDWWSDEGPNSGNSGVEASCPQKDLDETEEHYFTKYDQDDGWGDYEDDYDSDSDIEDDDQYDEIEERRRGPIYAFLVDGGVQLRPDEYVLLFRALGVSPQEIEQIQCSNSETCKTPRKAPSYSLYAQSCGAAQLGDGIIGSKASPPDGRSFMGGVESGNSFSRRKIGRRGISEKREDLLEVTVVICCTTTPRTSSPAALPLGMSPQKVRHKSQRSS